MADVPGKFYRATKVRTGVAPSSAGSIEGEVLPPVNPPGSSLNSVGLTMPSAFTVSNSPLTANGTIGVAGAGTVAQYIRGDGSLADFPESSGGGSSVSYYLNGSVDQGTIGGIAYKELSKVPILGAGTDFTINADGYIASFITDAGDPSLLEIPGGNWNFETYFSASSSGGTPTFYVELYKVSGTTATLIASSSSAPELIAFGTNLTPYFSSLAVPTTTLALTDRLAVRYYVTHSGRTITLHTENNHLCQIVTTFTTGITALNGLTAQVQNFAVGTSGTDFNIASATATHTFNLPTASATNRGALSSADWSLFTQAYNDKINSAAVTGTTTKTLTLTQQDGGTITASWSDLNTDAVLSVFGRTGAVVAANGDYTTAQVTESGNLYYTEARVNANANVAANTAARHNAVTLGTANGLSLSTQVLSLGLASAGVTGALSGSDWSTFNSKQNALTLTTTGTSGAATLVGATLNIPQYQAAGTYVTSVTASSPLFSSGGTTPNITIQQASSSQSGFLSSTDWTTFNNKQNALTNPVTGTGTTNYLPKFTGSTTIGNSSITDTGSLVTFTTLLRQEGQYIQISNSTNPSLYINNNVVQWQNYVKSNYNLAFSDAVRDVLTLGYNGSPSFFQGCNLLVGTTTDNGARLQVSGTATFSSHLTVTSETTSSSLIQQWVYNGNPTAYRLRLNTLVSSGLVRYSFDTTNNFIEYPNNIVIDRGNVGVGTSPNTKFEVTSGNSASAEIQRWSYNDGNAAYSLRLKQDVSAGLVKHVFDVVNNSTTYANNLVLTNGNIGIGTPSPSYKLDVQNASDFDIRLRDTSLGGTVGILFETGNDFSGTSQAFIKGIGAGNSGVSQLIFGTAGSSGDTSATERMRITSGGEILIAGSFNPFPATNRGNITLNGSASNIITFTNNSAVRGYLFHDNTNLEILNNTVGGVLSFYTEGSHKMRITSGGNVLIGTTTDNGAKLNVNGTVFIGNLASGSNAILDFATNASGGPRSIIYRAATAFLDFTNTAGSAVFQLSNGGAATFSSSVTATSFFESSDATLKTLIADNYQAKGIDSVVAKLYIKNGKEELGYFAQDLQYVLPSAVSKGSDGLLNLSYREVHTAKIAYLEEEIRQIKKRYEIN